MVSHDWGAGDGVVGATESMAQRLRSAMELNGQLL